MLNLIHLADGSGRSVLVRILGRAQPGILTGHDFLESEIVVTTGEALGASFPVTLLPEDLEDWEGTLARLEAGEPARWLDSGRTPSLAFNSQENGALLVCVHDEPATGATVTVPLTTPSPTWTAEQRSCLARVREAYPQEVVETSPGAYEWRHGRRPTTEPGATG
ncbi:DUF5959 family protein [Streptomyces albogriseolus]|uniref:DUF5959 family protein n=1 Tax=Streptomyces albogriseolus TaxID=1887 RepID=UPI0033B0794E